MIYKFIKHDTYATYAFSDSTDSFLDFLKWTPSLFGGLVAPLLSKRTQMTMHLGRNRAVSETSHENIMPLEMFLVREVLEVSEINTKMSIVDACECLESRV